jgi:hypothetical protein
MGIDGMNEVSDFSGGLEPGTSWAAATDGQKFNACMKTVL